MIQVHHGEAESLSYPDDHFDCLVTDPPYGYGFMGKDWDKAVVGVAIWKEIFRVMKPGAFGFIMSAPRQDCLSRMVVNLQEAGFETGFTSIYWAYATGFPKAQNISKAVDKKLGVKKVVGSAPMRMPGAQAIAGWGNPGVDNFVDSRRGTVETEITAPASPEAKALDGAYAGFQPKPAIEVILVVMKPLSEKTYLDQAMKDGKGVTWLEAGRIPYKGTEDQEEQAAKNPHTVKADNAVYGDYSMCREPWEQPQGRFPANLLVSDDVLDDGRVTKSTGGVNEGKLGQRVYGDFENKTPGANAGGCGDTGSFSRYFDLDTWWKSEPWVFLLAPGLERLPESAHRTFPFLIVPKASKAEKNQGCRVLENETYLDESRHDKEAIGCNNPRNRSGKARKGNIHPTVKPVKLMSYLIAIGSRPGDIIIDPFMGSGTTLVAAKAMGRRAVGVDNDGGCIPIAEARVKAVNQGLF